MKFVQFSWLIALSAFLVLAGCSEEDEFSDLASKVEERVKDEGKKIAALKLTSGKVMGDERFSKYFNTCPAQHFGTEKSTSVSVVKNVLGEGDVDMEMCLVGSELCLAMCVEGDGEACLSLAYALEEVKDQIGGISDRMAYGRACAAGSASGCTNRGGGIVNAPMKDDPMSNLPDAQKHACTFGLFDIACSNDDGWGCVMLGDAHAEGQGTVVDYAKAREYFDKACAGADEDDDACNFAASLKKGLPGSGN